MPDTNRLTGTPESRRYPRAFRFGGGGFGGGGQFQGGNFNGGGGGKQFQFSGGTGM